MNVTFQIFPMGISSDSAADKINVETEFPEKYLQEYAENNPDVDIAIERTDKVREMPDLIKRIDEVVASSKGRIAIRL